MPAKRFFVAAIAVAVVALSGAPGCGDDTDTSVEEPTIRPNLPAVPNVPPSPYPITYPDGTYTVYGLRKRLEHTMDTDVRVTATIVDVYVPPECPEGRTCPPAKMPHLWLGDSADEQDANRRLTLVGYAANQKEIDDAREDAAHGRTPEPPEGEGLPPIPIDLDRGRRGIFEGRFARISGAGFLESEGLLDYRNHRLEGTPEAEPTKNR
ncbi:MAG: hypothetical protein HYY06_27465 [Deltaproteobacteria bacterium]|nr:hypothetical protein [Deltaproteobacteria bacterium]